jgi:hypothetical protein
MRRAGLRRSRWWALLLLVPTAAVLLTPLAFRSGPAVLGIPLFWWYQLAWVPVSAAVLGAVAWLAPDEEEPAGPPPPEWWLNWVRHR